MFIIHVYRLPVNPDRMTVNSMKDTYLVTGGAGFIGSHLIDHLVEEGIPESSIRLVLRHPDKPHRRGKFSIVHGDLEDPTVAKKAVEGISVIYHLAAISGFGGVTINDYRRGNVLPTQNLLNAIKQKKIKKFVMFSTIAVYGIPSGIGNILGWNETHPQSYTEIYGQSKSEAEMIVRDYHNKYHIPYTIIRPTSVYGPRDFGQLYGVFRAISRGYFFHIGNGKNKLDFVFVKDLVKGTRLAELSKKKSSDYILGSGNPTSMNEVAYDIALSVNKPGRFIHIPTNFALPLSYGIEGISKLIHRQLPLFPSRVRIITSSYYYDISKAKKELGYSPSYSFKEAVLITGKWYLDNHLL